jgi:DNA-binding CsgD family transcriptional regulator
MKVTLTGRKQELAMVDDALSDAPSRGSAILFVGESGIGKTRCLLAAEELANSRARRVLRATGRKTEAGLPYAGLHHLLSPLLPIIELLPTVQRIAILTALGLEDALPPEPFVVSLATLNLVAEAAKDGGVLITVDDIQWLDSDTKRVIAFLARRATGRGIAIIATSSLTHLWDESNGIFPEQTIDRLEESEANTLLREHAPDLSEAQQTWVLERALGNPLALQELVATVPDGDLLGPEPLGSTVPLTPTLIRAFAGALDELSEANRDAVLVAAVAFDDSLQEILAATSALADSHVTATILDEPVRLGLLSYDENRIAFRHPLVKSAVIHRASASRRYAAHRALGEVITVNSRRRTWHRAWGVAGHDDPVASELESQGWADVRRDNAVAALLAFERAAELSTTPVDRGRRLLLGAKQAADLGRFDKMALMHGAAVSNELSYLDKGRAELLSEQCGMAGSGDSEWVKRLCASVSHALAADEHGLAVDLALAASLQRHRAPLTTDAQHAVHCAAQNVVGRAPGHPRVVAVLGLVDPVEHGRTVVSTLNSVDADTLTSADTLFALMLAARAVGDYGRCSQFSDRAETVLRGNNLRGALVPVLCLAADIRLELGYWERGAEAIAEAFSLNPGSRNASHPAELLVTAAKAAALMGDASRALELVAEAELSTSARSGSSVLARAQIARGIAYIGSGRHGEAVAVLSRVFDKRDPSHHSIEQFNAVTYLAEASIRSGQRATIEVIVRQLEPVSEACGSDLLLMQLQYARAVLADDETAEALFVEALAADSAIWPWPRARLQLSYGRWLRRHRQSSRSRGPLTDAYSTLERLGAKKWAQEAHDELDATSRRNEDDRKTRPAVACLSTQELKIARLAAEGLSNSEIGHQLCLSPRTVGSHLYRMFPKLEISSRRELAERLAQSVR